MKSQAMDFTSFFEKNTIQSQFREKWKYEILGQIELKKHEDFDKLANNCEIFGKTNKINCEGFGIFRIFAPKIRLRWKNGFLSLY